MTNKLFSSTGFLKKESSQISVSILILVVAFGALYMFNLDGWLINDDEGSFLYQVWQISEGQQPYQDVFTSRWPLFLYTGASWMRAFGATVFPMRVLAVALTLGTGIIVFLIAHQILPAEAALLSVVIYWLFPDVLRYGRLFQPEPFYIFFNTLGLYFFILGYKKKRLGYFVSSGAVFSLSTLYKLLAILALSGCVLFLIFNWFLAREERRSLSLFALALLVPYVILFGLVFAFFLTSNPQFFDSVIGVNLAQGQGSPLSEIIAKGLIFLITLVIINPAFLLALSTAWYSLKKGQVMALLSLQLPTALAYLLLSRTLFPRLLLYLAPTISILLVAALEPIRLQKRKLLQLAIIGALILPWFIPYTDLLLRKDLSTQEVVKYIQAETSPDTVVLSDYQELNFHAQRQSTYLGSEISEVIVKGGKIMGASLINEIKDANVGMIVLDTSEETGRHLAQLQDYAIFINFLEQEFTLANTLSRGNQRLDIYIRPDSE